MGIIYDILQLFIDRCIEFQKILAHIPMLRALMSVVTCHHRECDEEFSNKHDNYCEYVLLLI